MPDWSGIGEGLKHAWNAFRGRDHPAFMDYGSSSSFRPDRERRSAIGADRSIVTAIYNRIAIDVAAVSIRHVMLDDNDRYYADRDSDLNRCLTEEANIDQTGRQFIQDVVMSMLDEGWVASVPIDTTFNPSNTNSYDIQSIRVGKIKEWFPRHIRVEVYNEKVGRKEEIIVPKKTTAIHENPLYSVMNAPNSTMQRLVRKLAMLDKIDEISSSGKLDMIIQLPGSIKSPARLEAAEKRRKQIEEQLTDNKYGIAYIDGTEKITQLNRSIENNLLDQIQYLTDSLYSQLGITPEVFNGTANEEVMLNYYNRTIEPILSAITDEYNRKFLTRAAKTRGQRIVYIRDPFRLVTLNTIANIADIFTRNEILSSNEIRAMIGFKPSDDPRAEQLLNKDINPYPMDEMAMENQNGMEEPVPDEEPLDPDNLADIPVSRLNGFNQS